MGDYQAATNQASLSGCHISTVVTAAINLKNIYKDRKHVVIPLHDHAEQGIDLKSAAGLIQEGRRRGNVLVHCYHGVSRSATLVIAYLMVTRGMLYKTAYQFVLARRACISPNPGFKKQLMLLEERLA